MERWRSAAMEALVARDHTACTGARQGCRATVNQWAWDCEASFGQVPVQMWASPVADVGQSVPAQMWAIKSVPAQMWASPSADVASIDPSRGCAECGGEAQLWDEMPASLAGASVGVADDGYESPDTAGSAARQRKGGACSQRSSTAEHLRGNPCTVYGDRCAEGSVGLRRSRPESLGVSRGWAGGSEGARLLLFCLLD
jgi:hypothetical protein